MIEYPPQRFAEFPAGADGYIRRRGHIDLAAVRKIDGDGKGAGAVEFVDGFLHLAKFFQVDFVGIKMQRRRLRMLFPKEGSKLMIACLTRIGFRYFYDVESLEIE